jgi:hypothetical protein
MARLAAFTVAALCLSLLLASTAVQARSQKQQQRQQHSLSHQQQPQQILLESSATTHQAADDSLVIPSGKDATTCQSLGFVSSSCPNVDWQTYKWIADKAKQRNIDYSLDFLFSGAKTHHGGTRMCQNWYRDLMCRLTFPKCTVDGQTGNGPCRSECERFGLTCPGLAMSCAAFDTPDKGGCWASTKQFAYGHSNGASSTHLGGMAMVLAIATATAALLRL